MKLRDSAKKLPAVLFFEQGHKLCFLHRSIKEWLEERKVVNVPNGHKRLANYIWDNAISPWLFPYSSEKEPPAGSYSLTYALHHLKESDRCSDIEKLVFEKPWQRMMLEEKGWNVLSDEITKLPILPQKREEVLLQLTKTDNNLIIRLKEVNFDLIFYFSFKV